MICPGVVMATRGILNNGGVIIPQGQFVIYSIDYEEVVVPNKNYVSAQFTPLEPPEIKQRFVKIKLFFEGKEIEHIQQIGNNVTVKSNDIQLEIVDGSPKVKITFEDEELNIL